MSFVHEQDVHVALSACDKAVFGFREVVGPYDIVGAKALYACYGLL